MRLYAKEIQFYRISGTALIPSFLCIVAIMKFIYTRESSLREDFDIFWCSMVVILCRTLLNGRMSRTV